MQPLVPQLNLTYWLLDGQNKKTPSYKTGKWGGYSDTSANE